MSFDCTIDVIKSIGARDGLRGCTQVAVYSVLVGSNPTRCILLPLSFFRSSHNLIFSLIAHPNLENKYCSDKLHGGCVLEWDDWIADDIMWSYVLESKINYGQMESHQVLHVLSSIMAICGDMNLNHITMIDMHTKAYILNLQIQFNF